MFRNSQTKKSLFEAMGTEEKIKQYYRRLPVLNNWEVFSRNDVLSLQLNYSQNNASSDKHSAPDAEVNYTCELKLQTSLVTADNSQYWRSLFNGVTQSSKRSSLWIANPILAYSLGFVTGAMTIGSINYSWDSVPPYLAILLLSTSAIYFIPIVLASNNAISNYFRVKIENKLDNAREFLDQGNYDSARDVLKDLKWSKLLLAFFPELHWQHYYLQAKAAAEMNHYEYAEESYTVAWKFANNDEQKFVTIRGIINLFAKKEIATTVSYATEQQAWRAKLPMQSIVYLNYLNSVRQDLCQVIKKLVDKDYQAAAWEFNKITRDGFLEICKPAYAVVYYQLRAVLMLCGQLYRNGADSMDPESRLLTAKADFTRANELMNRYFINLADQNSETIQRLIDTIRPSVAKAPEAMQANYNLTYGTS